MIEFKKGVSLALIHIAMSEKLVSFDLLFQNHKSYVSMCLINFLFITPTD